MLFLSEVFSNLFTMKRTFKIQLMVQKSQTTTQHVWNPVNNGIFLPSTVPQIEISYPASCWGYMSTLTIPHLLPKNHQPESVDSRLFFFFGGRYRTNTCQNKLRSVTFLQFPSHPYALKVKDYQKQQFSGSVDCTFLTKYPWTNGPQTTPTG